MAKSDRYRRFLNVIIAGSMLGAIVGVMPSVLERIRGDNPSEQSEPAKVTGPTTVKTTAVVAGPEDLARRYQQMDLLRDDLAAREALVGAQEAALKRNFLGRFWKRQAAVSAATMCLSLAVVLAALWRTMGRRALQGGLPSEEARLRSLQMAVIGGLEEFEANLLQAKRGVTGDELTQAARAEGLQVVPAAATEPPVQFADRAEREAPGSFFPDKAESEVPADRVWEAARESLLEELHQREASAEVPARPRESNIPPNEPFETTSDDQVAASSSWARRFFDEEAEEPLAQAQGPWQEPNVRMPSHLAPPSEPIDPPRLGIREQIEYLEAEGCTPADIARRLGVSREEIALVMQLRSQTGRLARGSSWIEPQAG